MSFLPINKLVETVVNERASRCFVFLGGLKAASGDYFCLSQISGADLKYLIRTFIFNSLTFQ